MDASLGALVASATTAGLVGLLGVPAYQSLVRRFNAHSTPYESLDDLYEDDDGAASIESQKHFTTAIPRLLGVLVILLGLFVGIGLAVLVTIGEIAPDTMVESWLHTVTWMFLVAQAVAVFIEPYPQRKYSLGISAAVSSLIHACAFGVSLLPAYERLSEEWTQLTLLVTQIGVALVAMLTFSSIQRRPTVYSDGRPVDGELTTSLFGRVNFSWSAYLIEKAEKNTSLEYIDLPQLPRARRADGLSERYQASRHFSTLWRTILWIFRWALLKQLLMISIKSIFMFIPQFAMLQILRILEAPDTPHAVGVWAWVCLLGAAMVFQSYIENWLYWVVYAELGIPMRNMFAALIYEKSIRRKDVKGASRAKISTTVTTDAQAPTTAENTSPNPRMATGPDAGEVAKEVDSNDEEIDQKTRQATINLVGVDSNRVSMFTTYAYFYPGTIIQIVVSVVFLGTIIGLKSLLVGLACFSLTIPMNIYASKKYSQFQGRLMDLRDKKLAVVNEALQGIRQIKFAALEQQWQDKIGEYRTSELRTQVLAFICDTFLISCYIWSPVLLSVGCLATYSFLYGDLAPSVAFTTIAILTSLEAALGVVPELTTEGIDAWISINRINEYLDAPELLDCIEPSEHILYENADIAWPADDQAEDADRFVLRNVSFAIPPKELTVITGKTGSGKSLLLASLLSEIDLLGGKIFAPKPPPQAERYDSRATRNNWIIDSAIAFVAQVPWIENATLRDNILFGLPYDSGRYDKVLEACALTKDLDMLDDGDMTEIGHNGVNLSGGQRWRVSFARALYSRAGILVLDDIFSAVDAHVGRKMFEEALVGELAHGRTRILVTHHASLVLPKTHYAIHLADGTVQYAGSVTELRRDGLLEAILEEIKSDEGDSASDESTAGGDENGVDLTKVMSRRSQRSAVIDDGGKTSKDNAPKKFVEDEKRETGAIKAAIYKYYISSSGGFLIWTLIMIVFATNQCFDVARGWWVSVWTKSYQTKSHMGTQSFQTVIGYQQPIHLWRNSTTGPFDDAQSNDTLFYLKIYVLISLGSCVLGTLKYFNTFMASIKASRILFAQLSYTVLRTPLRWLDTVPVGRILNRFTADFNIVDSNLASHMGFCIYKVGETIGITGVSFVTSPYMIPLALLLLSISAYIARRFLTVARSTKRLENNAKSPIFELFGSTLIGIATVRGYSKGGEYIERMYRRIDEHGRSFWNLWLMNRWMGIRLSLIGSLFTFCVAMVIAASAVPATLAGFALAFSLNYSDAIIWVLRAYAALELDMTAAERVVEFSSLEIEDQGGREAPAAWPAQGRLEVQDLVCGYAPDLPPVLKGLTFTAESGQRIGVVGRTGAGKSSLTLALFRFLEARSGTVHIDGIDIKSLTLASLRSRLAIIPQDPVLFSGTVRSNLDPFDQHSDSELRDALERVHLVASASSSPPTEASSRPGTSGAGTTRENLNPFRSLSSRISEGGLNLSQGQRQLLCLARAIVARPKLMVLDEATSAVDKETDALIQRSIRDEFAGSTLIVIAHRLSTIADFDRILVLGEGRKLEFGTPRELFDTEGSVFRDMVEMSGEREDLETVIRGN